MVPVPCAFLFPSQGTGGTWVREGKLERVPLVSVVVAFAHLGSFSFAFFAFSHFLGNFLKKYLCLKLAFVFDICLRARARSRPSAQQNNFDALYTLYTRQDDQQALNGYE